MELVIPFISYFVFLFKCSVKMSAVNFKISFKELSSWNRKILAQQSAITFAQAFQQVQRLKEPSKVNNSSKNSRSNS